MSRSGFSGIDAGWPWDRRAVAAADQAVQNIVPLHGGSRKPCQNFSCSCLAALEHVLHNSHPFRETLGLTFSMLHCIAA